MCTANEKSFELENELLLGHNILNIPVLQCCSPGVTGISWIVIVWLSLVTTVLDSSCFKQQPCWVLGAKLCFKVSFRAVVGLRTAGDVQAGWVSLLWGKLWARLQGNSLYYDSGSLELLTGEDPVSFGFPCCTLRFFLLFDQLSALKKWARQKLQPGCDNPLQPITKRWHFLFVALL